MTRKTLALIGCVLFLSFITVAMQVIVLGNTNQERLDYLQSGPQLIRHNNVLEGKSTNPWQYRVLAEYAIEPVLALFRAAGIPFANAVAFVLLRFVQNIAVFALVYAYYRALRYKGYAALMGMVVLGWSMTHSNYGSDLSFNTYFDVIFYLLAGLAILHRRVRWIVPITLLAALNRDTSGLIPILALAAYWYQTRQPHGAHPPMSITDWLSPKAERGTRDRVLFPLLALACYAVIFVGLRLIYGPRPVDTPAPGLTALLFNLTYVRGWIILLITVSLIPFMALYAYRRWPALLYPFFWAMVPLWFGIHLFTSIISETRLFLVPLALVLIPGGLAGLEASREEDTA